MGQTCGVGKLKILATPYKVLVWPGDMWIVCQRGLPREGGQGDRGR